MACCVKYTWITEIVWAKGTESTYIRLSWETSVARKGFDTAWEGYVNLRQRDCMRTWISSGLLDTDRPQIILRLQDSVAVCLQQGLFGLDNLDACSL